MFRLPNRPSCLLSPVESIVSSQEVWVDKPILTLHQIIGFCSVPEKNLILSLRNEIIVFFSETHYIFFPMNCEWQRRAKSPWNNAIFLVLVPFFKRGTFFHGCAKSRTTET